VEERFGSVGLRREGLRERQLHREASREGGTLLRAANRSWWLITLVTGPAPAVRAKHNWRHVCDFFHRHG
jgi:hypothetical protein